MPTDEQVQKFIAELQGWTLKDSPGLNKKYGPCASPLKAWFAPDGTEYYTFPNWPTSLDVARGLPIGEGQYQRAKFVRFLGQITGGSQKTIFATAYQWCLTWILSEHGYRWVECGICVDGYDDDGGEGPGFTCKTCSGAGGEWRKV